MPSPIPSHPKLKPHFRFTKRCQRCSQLVRVIAGYLPLEVDCENCGASVTLTLGVEAVWSTSVGEPEQAP